MPIASFMTICRVWMTMTFGGASRPSTNAGTKPLPYWRGMRCRRSLLNWSRTPKPAESRASAPVLSLARASGAAGMVLGQALDIAAETASEALTLDEITALQRGKTGALIEWSATAGARLAQADIGPLQEYARALGLAFQIADDVLDVIGDSATVGKAVGKDAQAGKATFVSLLGLEEAQRRARDLVETACESLGVYGTDADTLKEAARFVVSRAY